MEALHAACGQSPLALQTQVLGEDALRRLVGLLSSHNRNVAEVAATVLARGCATPEQVPLPLLLLTSPCTILHVVTTTYSSRACSKSSRQLA